MKRTLNLVCLIFALLLGSLALAGQTVTTKVIKNGKGKDRVSLGDVIAIQYNARVEKGQQFDKTTVPFDFVLGKDPLLKGLEIGLIGMKVGEVRRIFIPAKYGFGNRQISSRVPKNSNLIFDVTLVSLKAQKPVPKKESGPATPFQAEEYGI